jgi:hypothetical protein
VYQTVQTLDDLRVFMAHDVYAVWDFMSLLKFLQHELAPSRLPWAPSANTAVRRFINEIVPLALLMLEQLVEKDFAREVEVEQAALEAIQARITFWDGVVQAIQATHADQRLAS